MMTANKLRTSGSLRFPKLLLHYHVLKLDPNDINELLTHHIGNTADPALHNTQACTPMHPLIRAQRRNHGHHDPRLITVNALPFLITDIAHKSLLTRGKEGLQIMYIQFISSLTCNAKRTMIYKTESRLAERGHKELLLPS